MDTAKPLEVIKVLNLANRNDAVTLKSISPPNSLSAKSNLKIFLLSHQEATSSKKKETSPLQPVTFLEITEPDAKCNIGSEQAVEVGKC